MAITYTWIISQLECKPEQDGLTNVVTTVHWRLRGVESEHTAEVYGSVALPGPGEPFTSYESLTQAQVEGWVESALGEQVQQYRDNIATQIAALINPPIVRPALPWAA